MPEPPGRALDGRRPRVHHGAMAVLESQPAPVPPSGAPTVVGGRYRPVVGLRRNAIHYAESTWREHGDVVPMVIGPPGMDRRVWWVHHPDAAARVFSGSSWRTYTKS